MLKSPARWFWLTAIILVGVSIWVGGQFPLPLAGNAQYALLQRTGALVWFQRHEVQEEYVHQLDLKTGQVTKVKFQRAAILGYRNSRGQLITLSPNVEVTDAQSGQVLYRQASSSSYRHLVGDQYLVAPSQDGFRVLNLDDVMTGPGSPGETSAATAIDQSFRASVPGVQVETTTSTALYPIEGTNRFLYHFSSTTPPRIAAYEIDASDVREISSWPTTVDTVILQHAGQVFTAAPTRPEVEVRSLQDFQLVQSRPLPTGLKAWNGFFSRNDLFSFDNTIAGVIDIYCLDDFTQLPPINMPVSRGGIKTERSDDRRYHMLCPNPMWAPQVVIYDSLERRVILDHAPLLGAQDIQIMDGHLVMVNDERGLTVDRVDLSTGQKSRLQPFVWQLVVLPIILLAAFVWIICWLRRPELWPQNALFHIAALVILLATPQLLHAAQFGGFRYVYRPAVGYSFMMLFALVTVLAWYLARGRQRILGRLAMAVLTFASIHAAINCFDLSSRLYLEARIMMQILLTYSIVTTATLIAIPLMRDFIAWLLGREGRGYADFRNVPLRDVFVLTACLAAFVAAVANGPGFLFNSNTLGTVLLSMFLMLPASLGMLGLSHSTRIAWPIAGLAILATLFLIAEITFHMWFNQYQIYVWFSLLIYLRYLVFLFAAVYVLARVIRDSQAGQLRGA